MSPLELTALVVVAAWLAALTLLGLLLVRQVGLMTVRLDRDLHGAAPVEDGLAVGDPIPEPIRSWLDGRGGPQFILVLGAVCGPCRELAEDLDGRAIGSPVLAVISGNPGSARRLQEALPAAIPSMLDPAAHAAVRALGISTTPFVFEVRGERIAAKAALRGADHLERFIGEAESVPDEELLPVLEVKGHVDR
jgi:hypothetical protein